MIYLFIYFWIFEIGKDISYSQVSRSVESKYVVCI